MTGDYFAYPQASATTVFPPPPPPLLQSTFTFTCPEQSRLAEMEARIAALEAALKAIHNDDDSRRA